MCLVRVEVFDVGGVLCFGQVPHLVCGGAAAGELVVGSVVASSLWSAGRCGAVPVFFSERCLVCLGLVWA